MRTKGPETISPRPGSATDAPRVWPRGPRVRRGGRIRQQQQQGADEFLQHACPGPRTLINRRRLLSNGFSCCAASAGLVRQFEPSAFVAFARLPVAVALAQPDSAAAFSPSRSPVAQALDGLGHLRRAFDRRVDGRAEFLHDLFSVSLMSKCFPRSEVGLNRRRTTFVNVKCYVSGASWSTGQCRDGLRHM